MASSARVDHGTKIIFGGGSGFALHGVRQRAHRQERQERLRPPTVSLPGVWSEPGAQAQEPPDRSSTQGRGVAGRGHRTPELAGRPARLWRGAWHQRVVATKKAEALPPLSETRLAAQAGDGLALDELWSFVGSKANARWVWIALCRQTRQVIAYFVGDRSAESARCSARAPPAGVPWPRPRAATWWLAYAEIFPPRTHRCTGKGAGETCHVERFNNTLRQRLGRFVRKTSSPSPNVTGCTNSLWRLLIHQYNQQPIL